MSSPVKTVTVQLDKPRKMRLTLGDARRFLEATKTQERPQGISIVRGDLAEVDLDEGQWLELFACCLRHEDPELTAETLEDLIDIQGFGRLGDAYAELMSALVPAEQEGAEVSTEEPAAELEHATP